MLYSEAAPATGAVVSEPAEGTPALLDKFTIAKPDLTGQLVAKLSAQRSGKDLLTYEVSVTNNSRYALNGAQVVVTLPDGVTLADDLNSSTTKHGRDIVLTIGRLEQGAQHSVQVKGRVAANIAAGTKLLGTAVVRSSTALPVSANKSVLKK